MKKLIRTSVVVLLTALVMTSQAFAGGKEFNGIIVYNITYDDDNIDPQMMAMMPKTMKMKIKGESSRTEISMGMGTTTVIFNGEDKSGITLMDFMGQKFALKMTADELDSEIEKLPEMNVEITDETKEIAGYTCKKAILKMEEKEYFVYFTEELGSGKINFSNPVFKDIKGVMLEYSFEENGMNMKFSAISVEKKKVADSEFEIPEGYKIVTQSELEGMFGG